jgi:hypothetical protein
LRVPAAEPHISIYAPLEAPLHFPTGPRTAFYTYCLFEPGRPQAYTPADHIPEAFAMLFDVIITLTLFSVLSRLTGRRRGDVLYYVSPADTPRRGSIGQSKPRQGIIRSARPARKLFSF